MDTGVTPSDVATMDESDDELTIESDAPLIRGLGPQTVKGILNSRLAENFKKIGGFTFKVVGDCSAVLAPFCNPADREHCDQPVVPDRLICADGA